jgi:predicted DsbA family dithiol-disulfide isomerase
MHHALFAHRELADRNTLYDLAIALRLNLEVFYRELEAGDLTRCLIKAVEEGRRLGVRTTPTLFVNGERQENVSLRGLQEHLARWLTGFAGTRNVVGTVDRLQGRVDWGQWPE